MPVEVENRWESDKWLHLSEREREDYMKPLKADRQWIPEEETPAEKLFRN